MQTQGHNSTVLRTLECLVGKPKEILWLHVHQCMYTSERKESMDMTINLVVKRKLTKEEKAALDMAALKMIVMTDSTLS